MLEEIGWHALELRGWNFYNIYYTIVFIIDLIKYIKSWLGAD